MRFQYVLQKVAQTQGPLRSRGKPQNIEHPSPAPPEADVGSGKLSVHGPLVFSTATQDFFNDNNALLCWRALPA